MSPSAFEDTLSIGFEIDKEPIWFDMAFPSACKIADEPMVSMLGLKRLPIGELLSNLEELIQVLSPFLLLLQLPLELIAIGNFEHLLEAKLVDKIVEVFAADQSLAPIRLLKSFQSLLVRFVLTE